MAVVNEHIEHELAAELVVDDQPQSQSRSLANIGSLGISMIVHTALLVALGVFTVTPDILSSLNEIVFDTEPVEEIEVDELITVELDVVTDPSETLTNNNLTKGEAVGVENGANAAAFTAPQLDPVVMEALNPVIEIEGPSEAFLDFPTEQLLDEVPEGTLGNPRQVVDNYDQAMDRITQELIWMLDRGDVLVTWMFDQSVSMKGDQQEIRERINRVYVELGLTEKSDSDHLWTAVTSYGSGYIRHTKKPTGNVDLIREAIDAVPVDPSGLERMCEAVIATVVDHRDYVKNRQMAIILVTDESGERKTNNAMLEQAINTAKSVGCRIYVLGREAIFGYPYTYMRWRHPQTGDVHWLQVDRGPETAFVEQLQTNGFRRRRDAFSSGFGPYEQCRMSVETNGIFFMLPTVEVDQVNGQADKRRYELEAMRPYLPDLSSRFEQLALRGELPMRTLIWQVITDLNPWREDVRDVTEVRMSFSINAQQFVAQAREEQQNCIIYLRYLARAQKMMEEAYELRTKETSRRWQANYDLIYAQIVGYQARIYEYGAALEAFMRNPPVVPAVKPPNLRLVDWDMRTTTNLVTPDISQPYIDKATELFELVIERHPGTAWSARAEVELARGFGMEIIPDYRAPRRRPPLPPGTPRIPIPKY